jgi:hypothetical protein
VVGRYGLRSLSSILSPRRAERLVILQVPVEGLRELVVGGLGDDALLVEQARWRSDELE